jgi:hypothetical protein
MPDVEIMTLVDGRYMVIIEDRPDAIGPLTKVELVAIWEALLDWRRDEQRADV